MTDDEKKPKPIQPERAVALIRKKAESYAARRATHLAKLGVEFDRREEAGRLETLERVPAGYQESARAMLRAIGLEVPELAVSGAPGAIEASPDSRPGVIDGEFAEAAEPNAEELQELMRQQENDIASLELHRNARDASPPEPDTTPRPSWLDTPPPPVTGAIEIDRSGEKARR